MNYLPLSYIAEYSYCQRSAFYLLVDEKKYRDENIFIQSGRQAHQKVDEGYSANKSHKKVESSFRVFSNKFHISGKVDILEFYQNNEIVPVELKRGTPRQNYMHQIQLALTTLCLQEMFPQKIINKGAIFFTKSRQRQEIIIGDELLSFAAKTAIEIFEKTKNGLVPKNFKPQKDSRCLGCCFYNLCYI